MPSVPLVGQFKGHFLDQSSNYASVTLLLRQKGNYQGGWELHLSRANYQAYIWRQNLVAQQKQFDPINHDWMHNDEENCLTVKWMKCKPAPDEVIPTCYTQMLFNQVQILSIILNFICELLLILFTLFLIRDIGIDGV